MTLEELRTELGTIPDVDEIRVQILTDEGVIGNPLQDVRLENISAQGKCHACGREKPAKRVLILRGNPV